MSGFEKVAIAGATYLDDPSGYKVLHVETPHALIQSIGYLKHTAQPYERVFFRGQRKLYASLRPTLYRDIKKTASQAKRHEALNRVLLEFTSKADIFENIPDYAHEPLLQHYGIKTSWIDLVDNVWVALWFALNQAFSVGRRSEFLHFERRRHSPDDLYGYLLLVAVDEDRSKPARKGFTIGSGTETVDLRIAAPSVFMRPHAQHGLLFRKRAKESGRPLDYADAVRGIVRFELDRAWEWLGKGTMHDVRSVFPPPFFDKGYQILLGCSIEEKSAGCIHHIGA